MKLYCKRLKFNQLKKSAITSKETEVKVKKTKIVFYETKFNLNFEIMLRKTEVEFNKTKL